MSYWRLSWRFPRACSRASKRVTRFRSLPRLRKRVAPSNADVGAGVGPGERPRRCGSTKTATGRNSVGSAGVRECGSAGAGRRGVGASLIHDGTARNRLEDSNHRQCVWHDVVLQKVSEAIDGKMTRDADHLALRLNAAGVGQYPSELQLGRRGLGCAQRDFDIRKEAVGTRFIAEA